MNDDLNNDLEIGLDDEELPVGGDDPNKDTGNHITPVEEDELTEMTPTFVLLQNISEALESGEKIDSLLIKEALKLHPVEDISIVLNIQEGPSEVNRTILAELLKVIQPKTEDIIKRLAEGLLNDVEKLRTLSTGIPLTMKEDICDLNTFIQNKVCNVIDDDMVSKDLLELSVIESQKLLNKIQIYSDEIDELTSLIVTELNMGESSIRDVMNYVDLLYTDFVDYVGKIDMYEDKLKDFLENGIRLDACLLVELRKEIFLASSNIKVSSEIFKDKKILNMISELFRKKLN